MLRYTLKRVALIVPSLLILSLLAFWISAQAPTDQITCAPVSFDQLGGGEGSFEAAAENNRQNIEKFNLHLPLFYVGIQTRSMPWGLHQIYCKKERQVVMSLAHQSGNGFYVEAYVDEIHAFEKVLFEFQTSDSLSQVQIQKCLAWVESLVRTGDHGQINAYLANLDSVLRGGAGFSGALGSLDQLLSAFERLENTHAFWNNYVPTFHWYGTENRYHIWIKKVVTELDFGESLITGSVERKLEGRFFWTLVFSFLSVLIAFLISIPMGVYAAIKKGKGFDRKSAFLLFGLDAIPAFWMAISLQYLLQFLFAENAPISFIHVNDEPQNLLTVFTYFHYLWLPLFAYTYPMLVGISRLMRASVLEEMNKPYMLTAMAKGLTRSQAVWRHAFPNAFTPMLALFGGVFASMLSGSVVLEGIFLIKGLGYAAFDSINNNDMYVVVVIFLITGAMTMVGYLLSDLLIAWFNPKVRFGNRS